MTGFGAHNIAYDNNGNLTSNDSNTYGYDYRNELISWGQGTASSTYLYKYDGDRIYYNVTTANPYHSRTAHYYNKYYEKDVDAYNDYLTTTIAHIYLNGLPVADITKETSSTTIDYIHHDHLGGMALTTDESGTMHKALDYYPYGDSHKTAGNSSIYSLLNTFTGHTYDPETSMIYMGARYYDAGTGRFFSEDPAAKNGPEQFIFDPQQMNLYSYARNNPLLYIDPTGEVLTISGSYGQAFVDQAYNALQQLDPHIHLEKMGNDFEVKFDPNYKFNVCQASNNNFNLQSKEQSLLLTLVNSKYTTTINKSDSGNSERHKDGSNLSNGVGENEKVYFDPNNDSTVDTYDPETGQVVAAKRPPFIGLSHELIHASRVVSGTYDNSQEMVKYKGVDGKTYWYVKEDIRTLGLGYNKPGDITENDIRKDAGIRPRNDYRNNN